MKYGDDKNFELLVGNIITSLNINRGDDEVIIETADGKRYRMYHEQDCCENVTIENFSGEVDRILNRPITVAQENVHETGGGTLTTYILGTNDGAVVIVWRGVSNGYYSESVSFVEV